MWKERVGEMWKERVGEMWKDREGEGRACRHNGIVLFGISNYELTLGKLLSNFHLCILKYEYSQTDSICLGVVLLLLCFLRQILASKDHTFMFTYPFFDDDQVRRFVV